MTGVFKPSRELVRHHAAEHLRRCPETEPVSMMCSCSSTVILACAFCHAALFLMVEPETQCPHAVEIRAGGTPSGVWVEVKP